MSRARSCGWSTAPPTLDSMLGDSGGESGVEESHSDMLYGERLHDIASKTQQAVVGGVNGERGPFIPIRSHLSDQSCSSIFKKAFFGLG